MQVEGFMLSISGSDVAVSAGRLGDLAVDALTISVSGAGLGDGVHNIVCDSLGSVTAQLTSTAPSDGDFIIGQFTEATAAATAISYAGRELKGVVSADDSVTL